VPDSTTSRRVTDALRSTRVHYDRAIDLLARLVPLARRLERAVRYYGLAVGGAAVVMVATIVAVDTPSVVWTWTAVIVLLAILWIAPAIILVFASMLREALRLPSELRSLPDVAPARAREIAQLVQASRDRPGTEAPRSFTRDTWRAGRLLNALRREVPGVSVLLSLARIPFMVAVLGAIVVGAAEILMVPFVVVSAVVVSVV
jgi:hypothetical protein